MEIEDNNDEGCNPLGGCDNRIDFSKKIIDKAKQAKSVEEWLALAKENSMDLTEEQAQVYSAQ